MPGKTIFFNNNLLMIFIFVFSTLSDLWSQPTVDNVVVVLMLLSTLFERFSVSCVRDFFLYIHSTEKQESSTGPVK